MTLPRADETLVVPARANLPQLTDEHRAIVARAESRRLALMADNEALRARYEEVMRWVNPPWDPITRRPDPRIDEATPEREGVSKIHVDLVMPVVDRWAVLQMGAAPIFRCKPPFVEAPVEKPDDPDATLQERKLYDIDRAIAQSLSTRMENQTQEWSEAANLHRTLLWAVWSTEAFGKGIVRTGWDDEEKLPTAELMENPSQVYYGWNRRYGRRKLSWVAVVEQMDVFEANRRYNLNLPTGDDGTLDVASWTGVLDQGEMDQQPEQQGANQRFLTVLEYHELVERTKGKTESMYALIVAGRVVEGPYYYPWKKLPFKVFENKHIPTWSHGKSVAETQIPINAALDDMLTRQHEVIEFESGPRYKGMNMRNNDEADVPAPFEMIPLGPDEDIQQLDTRVDFFPSELHSNQLYEATHRSTGLTPIAWGMSPNAQTSGRAMSAEWRAVELPMTGRLINLGPEIREIFEAWWDYAEQYHPPAKRLAQSEGLKLTSYRRFEVIWVPLDIRDKTEKTLDVIQRYQADLLDPETALEELGHQNVDEIIAKIRSYMLDAVWNPLRRQQYLTLQQLELTIRQTMLQVQAMEAEMAPQQPAEGEPLPEDLIAQGANAAGQAAQGPAGPVTEAQNQPGMSPAGGGLPMESSILSQTPLDGGIGNRVIVPLGGPGPAPTGGAEPT